MEMFLEFQEGPLVDGLLCCVWCLFIKWGLVRAVCRWWLHVGRGWEWVGVAWWGRGCSGGEGLKWYGVVMGGGWWVGR